MSEVFKNEKNFLSINKKWIENLKKELPKSPKKISRLLMHLNHEDHVQEMLIAFSRDSLIPPNKNVNKSESLHVIEGKLLLIIFDDNGKISDKIIMQAYGVNENAFVYRFNKCKWHTMKALSDLVVVHETLEGPFEKTAIENPDWIPKNSHDLKNFLEKIN